MLKRGSILLATCASGLAMASGVHAATPQATLLPGGRAVAPAAAPPAVEAMIEAGNRIRHRPYSLQ